MPLGEPGLMLNMVGGKLNAKYDGYHGQKQLSESKLVYDVVEVYR